MTRRDVLLYGASETPHWLPYLTRVHSSGRYFLDQSGAPFLVKGDSPWLGFAAISTTDWATYCATRAAQGFNSLIVDLVGWNLLRGAGVPGSPDAGTGGETFDGVFPFVGGDIKSFNSTYWSRVDTMVATAETYGLTLFIYAVDYYATAGVGEAFNGKSTSDCQAFGALVGARYKSAPNIVWVFGNDYPPSSTPDAQMRAVITGLRAAGDQHLFSATLNFHLSYTYDGANWTDSAFWFDYSYPVQYSSMKAAYDHSPTKPAVMSEAAYVGESYTDGNVPLTIRKQVGWSLSQGGAGEFMGTEDWYFKSGWAGRLSRSEIAGVSALRSIFEAVAWWTLVPSTTFVTSGAGTRVTATNSAPGSSDWPAASDYASSAVSADGKLAVVYLPTQRAIQVNTAALGTSPVGTWLNASTGAATAAGSLASSVTPPAAGDWVLRITAS